MTKAILVDYKYCTGCHTCEVACQIEHGFAPTKLGIEVKQHGPFQLDETETKWQYNFFPAPTNFCDGCENLVSKGKRPTCMHHCQTGCLTVGELADLLPLVGGKKKVLFTI